MSSSKSKSKSKDKNNEFQEIKHKCHNDACCKLTLSKYDDYESLKINEDNNTDYHNDEIGSFLSRMQNKYSGNADQKHLNQLYDIGILITNKSFNKKKLIHKINKIIDDRSRDPIKKVSELKRIELVSALKRGIKDGMSDEYRFAYDKNNTYQYDSEKLKKRAHIDSVLNHFSLN